MEDLALDAHRIPGIGPMRRARLAEAGVATLDQLAAADPDALAALPGFNLAVVAKAQEAVRDVLSTHRVRALPEVTELDVADEPREREPVASEAPEEAVASDAPEDAPTEPPKKAPQPLSGRERRGLDAARRIERTLEMVARAREHARKAKKAERKRTRRQLRKLARALQSTQQELIRDGVSKAAAAHLDALLSPLEKKMKRFSKKPLTKNRLAKTRKRARAARKALSDALD
jgi:hypothetical protein